jgi:hypothetical protein
MTSTTISSTAPAWPLWAFRIVASVAALLLFAQSILAGLFLADKHNKFAFLLHKDNAILSVAVVLVLVVAAILSVRPGRGPRGVIVAAAGLLVVTAGEAAAGFAKLTVLHIPLAVVLIGIAAAMAVASWRRTVPVVSS